MRDPNIFETINPRLHDPVCRCADCHPRMPGEPRGFNGAAFWMMIAAIAICAAIFAQG